MNTRQVTTDYSVYQNRQLCQCSLSAWTVYKNIYKGNLILIINEETQKNLQFLKKLNAFLKGQCKNLEYSFLNLFQILLLPTNTNTHVTSPCNHLTIYASTCIWALAIICPTLWENSNYVSLKFYQFCFSFFHKEN